jgi:hypothetical protein
LFLRKNNPSSSSPADSAGAGDGADGAEQTLIQVSMSDILDPNSELESGIYENEIDLGNAGSSPDNSGQGNDSSSSASSVTKLRIRLTQYPLDDSARKALLEKSSEANADSDGIDPALASDRFFRDAANSKNSKTGILSFSDRIREDEDVFDRTAGRSVFKLNVAVAPGISSKVADAYSENIAVRFGGIVSAQGEG